MLRTEMRNPETTNIHKMTTHEIVKIMNQENKRVIFEIDKVLFDVTRAVDAVAEAFDNGGRLFYVGAGTSGRLGVLDAAECPPTFGVSYDLVNAIIAGGPECMIRALENEEDNEKAGIDDITLYHINKNDIVVGISASGGTAYVIGALKKAKEMGCTTVGITSNSGSLLDQNADISICPDTGAEVITGSTRLKAGTAQKLILNMISTGAMIKTGKVYENLMINVKPVNKKLHKRCINIIAEITGSSKETAKTALLDGGSILKAIEIIKGE